MLEKDELNLGVLKLLRNAMDQNEIFSSELVKDPQNGDFDNCNGIWFYRKGKIFESDM